MQRKHKAKADTGGGGVYPSPPLLKRLLKWRCGHTVARCIFCSVLPGIGPGTATTGWGWGGGAAVAALPAAAGPLPLASLLTGPIIPNRPKKSAITTTKHVKTLP